MADKRVFLAASGRLTVYHWRGPRLAEPRVFAADDAGLADFSRYLDAEPDVASYMLVDFVEEEFREETIPHVFGSDRRALIRNRVNRLFRDSRYSQAILQGREAGGRRDDRVLFTALIRPDMLAPWLAQLTRHGTPLVGIYSLPVTSALLLKPLGFDSGGVLLVTLQSSGGLRQTYFRDGMLRVSRLAVMPELDPARYASYMLSEVEKLRRYLGSLRLLRAEEPLDVCIVSHGGILEDLRRQASDAGNVRFHCVGVNDVAPKVALRGKAGSPYADLLFAQLLVRRSPPNQYANPDETRFWRMHRMSVGMKAASVLLILAGAVWGGLTFVEGLIARQQTVLLDQQIGFYAERYRRAKERLPEAPAGAADLKATVDLASALEARRTSPATIMTVLSEGLSLFPNVRIDALEWKVSANPEETFSGARQAPAPVARAAGPGAPRQLYHLAHVKGRIAPFDGDYRRAMSMINEFTTLLSARPRVEEVIPLKLPLDVSPDQRVEGRAGAEVPEESAVDFELRVVVRGEPA